MNKNGYLFPCILHIKPVYHILKDATEFFAIIKKEKTLKNYCYIVVNNEGTIDSVSSSSINILNLEARDILLQNVNITNLIPDFFDYMEEFQQKQGKQIKITHPKVLEDSILFDKGGTEVELLVNAYEQHVQSLNKSIGYVLKAELIQKKPERKKKKQGKDQSLMASNMFEKRTFQFKYCIQDEDIRVHGEEFIGQDNTYGNFGNNTFALENEEDNGENYLNITTALQNTNSNILVIQSKKEHEKIMESDLQEEKMREQEQRVNKNYGEGYKIVRWQNGNFFEVEKDDSENESDEERKERVEEEQRQISQQQASIQQEQQFQDSGFHSAKDLNEELQKQSESISVKQLRIFSFLVVLIMITLSSVDYALKIDKISSQRVDLRQILISSRQLAEIQEIISIIRELALTNRGIRIPQYTLQQGVEPNSDDDLSKLKTMLEASIREVEQLTIEISQNQKLPQSEVDIYFDLVTNQMFDINYATQQLISKAFAVKRLEIDDIRTDQSDAFFIMHNGLNDYCKVLISRYSLVNQLTIENLDDLNASSTVILIVSICLMVICRFNQNYSQLNDNKLFHFTKFYVFCMILTVLLGRTILAKQIVLSIFLDIPEKSAKFLYSKCEGFILNMSFSEDDDLRSENDLMDNTKGEDEQRASIFGRRRKRFKNADKGNITFLFKMLILAIFIEIYFVINYIFGNEQVYVMQELLKEFNQTTIAEPMYSLTMNAEFQLVLDEEWTVFNEPPLEYIPVLIDTIYEIDSNIHMEHTKNTEDLKNAEGYLDVFDNIFFNDVCQLLVEKRAVGINECAQFGDGLVSQGMVTVVVRYFQILRYVRDRFEWINRNPDTHFDFSLFEGYTPRNFSDNTLQNNIANVVTLPDTYEMIQIQTIYLKNSFRYLQDSYTTVLNYYFDAFEVQRILLLVLFILLFFFSFLLCWQPYLLQLNKEIWSTKCLLSFIPVDEMAKIKSINQFIREVIIDRKI